MILKYRPSKTDIIIVKRNIPWYKMTVIYDKEVII